MKIYRFLIIILLLHFNASTDAAGYSVKTREQKRKQVEAMRRTSQEDIHQDPYQDLGSPLSEISLDSSLGGSEYSSLSDSSVTRDEKENHKRNIEIARIKFDATRKEYADLQKPYLLLQNQLKAELKKLQQIQACHQNYKPAEDEVDVCGEQTRVHENIRFDAMRNEKLKIDIEQKIAKRVAAVRQLTQQEAEIKQKLSELRQEVTTAYNALRKAEKAE